VGGTLTWGTCGTNGTTTTDDLNKVMSRGNVTNYDLNVVGKNIYTNKNLVVGTNTLFANSTTGNVGIGTTSPNTSLEILSATNGLYYGNLSIRDTTAQAAGVGGRIGFGGKYTDAGDYLSAWATIAGLKTNSTTGNYGGYLALSTRPNGGSMTERARIDESGNVGIGTATPSFKLDVVAQDAVNAPVMVTNYQNAGAILGRRANGTPASPTALASGDLITATLGRGYNGSAFTTTSNGGMYLYAGENWTTGANGTYLTFETTANAGTTRTEKLRVSGSGNVGIGTTAPENKLHVYSDSSDNSKATHGTLVNYRKTAGTNDAYQNAGIGIQTGWVGSANFTSTNSGIYGTNYFGGTGTMTTQNGMWFIVGTTGDNNGSVTTRNGAMVQAFSTSAKPVTNSYGVHVLNMAQYNSPANTAAFYADPSTTAVGTTKYGLRIGDQSGATNNYAIYTGLGTVLFGDKVGINVTPSAMLTLPAGTTTANTAPLKFTSGSLLTATEAGAVEFLTDNYYATITSGTGRKKIVLTNGETGLTSGRIPYATTNGRLTDSSSFLFDTTNGITLTDNVPLSLGDASDAKLSYDGTNLLINPKSVGSGQVQIQGDLNINSNGAGQTYFDANGTMKLYGNATVWKDMVTDATVAKSTGANQPLWEAFTNGVYTHQFNQGTMREVWFGIQVNHDYQLDSNFEMHVHWAPMTTGTGDVNWCIEYTISDLNGIFPASKTICSTSAGLTTMGTALRHNLTSFGSPFKCSNLSCVIKARVFRDGGTYADKVSLLSLDAHYIANSLGSNEMLVK
jgi:hypothetical protein